MVIGKPTRCILSATLSGNSLRGIAFGEAFSGNRLRGIAFGESENEKGKQERGNQKQESKKQVPDTETETETENGAKMVRLGAEV